MKRKLREFLKKISYFIAKHSAERFYPLVLGILYRIKIGRRLNLTNPQRYTEKLQWLKLYGTNPLKAQLADKYEVRRFVKDKIGEQYLVPLLGVWDNFDDIDFDKLPDKFVLKCTHGSAMNIIVKDKASFDKEEARAEINKWLNTNLAYVALELHYKSIKPRIIAEAFLETPDDDLRDYKIMCFSGKAHFIWIDSGRYSSRHTRSIYDMSWNLLPLWADTPRGGYFAKPPFIDQMIELAQKLSCNFAHERVDFYYADGKIYFGEFTLTPWGGLGKIHPDEYDFKLGSLIKLPSDK